MVFQTSANDLPFIVQVLRTDETHDAVHQKGIELPGHTIGASFEGELVDPMMGFRRKSASLPGFEIHRVLTFPGHIPPVVVFDYLFSAFAEHLQGYAEAFIRCLSSRNGL